jgi:hypothetical protein
VTTDDMAPVMEQYEAGRKGGSFETGIEHGLRLILANPKFLFRVERARGQAGPVSDLELRRGCRSSCGAPSRTKR